MTYDLREKQKYGHIYVDMPEENAWAHVQVKVEDEGIVLDVYDIEGDCIHTTYFFWNELQRS
jgi:hypothetical protein